MVQIESRGFDESVNIIVLPKTNNQIVFSDQKSRVFQNIPFSKAFFIPAENEVLIDFAPIKNRNDN
jgi:hypothetical protein